MTPEEAKQKIAEAGFEANEPPDYRIWERIWCRISGNHIWCPVYIYDLATERVYEEGAICERCYKERP